MSERVSTNAAFWRGLTQASNDERDHKPDPGPAHLIEMYQSQHNEQECGDCSRCFGWDVVIVLEARQGIVAG